MPIKKALRWYYPIDWQELSDVVRFDRAGGRCEDCQRLHGQVIHHLGDGRWFDPLGEVWRDDQGQEIDWPDYDKPERRTIPLMPKPSAVAKMTLARAMCFKERLRSLTIPSRRRRSSGVTVMLIPVLIQDEYSQAHQMGIR